jgi:DNA-binding MarR family transcriptional regulator
MDETPPSLLDLTTYLLSRVGKAARGRLGERLARSELRLWHMAVLAALTDFGPHSQRELSSRLSIDPSDMVKLLDELSTRGWVERTRDVADRRRIQVTITNQGRSALADLTREAEAVQHEVLASLDEQERAQLHGLLLQVFRQLNSPDQGEAGTDRRT